MQISTKWIAPNAVTNSVLDQIPAYSIKGNNTGSIAEAADLGLDDAKAMLTALTVVSVSSDYGIGPFDQIFLVTTEFNPVYLTMCQPLPGRNVVIKDISGNAGTNNITLVPFDTESIEGSTSPYVLNTNWVSTRMVSDGTNWYLT